MTFEMVLQFLIPLVAGFVLRHVMPTAGSGSASFPTSIGHGEVIAWLAAKLVAAEKSSQAPSPSPAADLSAELTAILRQVLAAQQPPQPAAKPA